MIELRVLEEISQQAVAQAHLKTEQMRKMQFILKIPRLQESYLKNNGIDTFIEKFTSIVAEN